MAGASGTRTRPPARGVQNKRAPSKRVQQKRSSRRGLSQPLVGLGHAITAIWRALAGLAGGIARAAGRNAATARDLDPEHRRDGVALGVLGFGLIAAMAVWFHAAGPVGRLLTPACRAVVGNGAAVLPLLLFGIAAHMLRQAPRPESRGRALVGSLALTVSVLGLFHLWAALPHSASGRARAGGLIGAAVAGPIARGLSAAIAVPLLMIVGVFGVLVVTATPVCELVAFVRNLIAAAVHFVGSRRSSTPEE